MFVPKELDLERLARNTEAIQNGRQYACGRGAGVTTAYLYLMLGEFWLGDHGNKYLYVAENSMMCRWVAPEFVKLLVAEGIQYSEIKKEGWSPDLIILNETHQVYRFISFDSLTDPSGNVWRGTRVSKVFFDAEHARSEASIHRMDNLYEAFEYLKSNGAEIV